MSSDDEELRELRMARARGGAGPSLVRFLLEH